MGGGRFTVQTLVTFTWTVASLEKYWHPSHLHCAHALGIYTWLPWEGAGSGPQSHPLLVHPLVSPSSARHGAFSEALRKGQHSDRRFGFHSSLREGNPNAATRRPLV